MTVIRWTETAASDLESIRDYIGRDSPIMAQLVVTRLYEAVSLLEDHPMAGRILPERSDPSLREIVRPPYRIVYERHRDSVTILTVFHSARMFPAESAPTKGADQ